MGYGVPITFAFGYAVWLAFDFLGHAYLGENAKAAAFLGRHYLAWALVGQAHFACRVRQFPAGAVCGAPVRGGACRPIRRPVRRLLLVVSIVVLFCLSCMMHLLSLSLSVMLHCRRQNTC